jgi:hypothetical protein
MARKVHRKELERIKEQLPYDIQILKEKYRSLNSNLKEKLHLTLYDLLPFASVHSVENHCFLGLALAIESPQIVSDDFESIPWKYVQSEKEWLDTLHRKPNSDSIVL